MEGAEKQRQGVKEWLGNRSPSGWDAPSASAAVSLTSRHRYVFTLQLDLFNALLHFI